MTLVFGLTAELERSLRAGALEAGLPLDEYVRRLLGGAGQPLEDDSAARDSAGFRLDETAPLDVVLERIWRDMPADVRQNPPEDGASQHDHYIYGTPKREV